MYSKVTYLPFELNITYKLIIHSTIITINLTLEKHKNTVNIYKLSIIKENQKKELYGNV